MKRAQRQFYRKPALAASDQRTKTSHAAEPPRHDKREVSDMDQEAGQRIPPTISRQLHQIGKRINVPFFDILDLLVEFGIPSVDLHKHGVVSTSQDIVWHDVHPLGAGHSCAVVQHATTEDMPLNRNTVLKAGTLVALKLFKTIDDEKKLTDKSEEQRLVYQSILKELEILSVPRLRNHENICQLLFVCWMDESPVPALALELAAFGSLEDVLVATGYGLSHLQKISITVDVALGLSTIHACGFVHGDLKPGNVVISQHETRQVVAKITDFGGSGIMASYDTETPQSNPVLATPAWCAPEVAYLGNSIDWQKADSYAYGLIVASTWSRPEQSLGSRPSSCILDFMLELELDVDEKQDLFLVLKSQPDNSQHSVVALCCQWIRCLDRDIHGLLCKLIRDSLRRDPAQRTSVTSILSTHIQILSEHTPGQPRDCEVSTTEVTFDEIQGTQHTRFKVWGDLYRKRSESFHKLWFNMAVAELQGFDCILALPTPRIPESHDPVVDQATADEFLTLLAVKLISYAEQLEEMHKVVVSHLSRLAFLVAYCYYNRLGTLPDEAAALKWLQVSALGGNSNALAKVSIVCGSSTFAEQQTRIGDVLAATGILLEVSANRGTSVASGRCLEVLKDKFPSAYQQVTRIIQQKEVPEYTRSRYGIDSVLAWLHAEPFQESRLTMRRALTHGNVSLAYALLDSDEDFSMIDEDGFGLMYYLIFLEDIDAAGLAPHVFAKGAKLDLQCRMTGEDPADGSVLCCAIRKGSVKFVLAILNLHEMYGIPIAHDVMVLSTAITVHDPRTLYIMWTLAERKPHLSPHIAWLRSGTAQTQLIRRGIHDYEGMLVALSSDECHEDFDYDELLAMAMTETDPAIIHRRANNMDDSTIAKWITVALLLKLRTAFRQVPQLNDDPVLDYALKQDDVLVFTLLISGTKISGEYLDGILQLAIAFDASLCFRATIRHIADKPGLLCALSPTHTDMTALQIAVRHSNAQYTQQLLHLGVDPTHEYLRPRSGVLWPALARALVSGRVTNAEALYEHYTVQQRENLWKAQLSGVTFVALILQQWIVMRDPLLLESLKWLESKGGAYFYSTDETSKPLPAWYILLRNPMALRQSDRLLDKRMMKLLVEIFPEHSDRLEEGIAPIHYAAIFGQLEIVEVLIADGTNVCLETGPGSAIPGKTAFDFCVDRIKVVPPKILRAGGIATNLWTLRFKALMSYLFSAGATNGSRCSFHQMAAWQSMSLHNTHAASASTRSNTDVNIDWPLPLPSDCTSTAVHNGDKVVVRLPDMTQVSVDRVPATQMFPNVFGKLEKPSDAFNAWLKSEGSRYRRIHRDSRWADDSGQDLHLREHLRTAIKERDDRYEYPELDFFGDGRDPVVALIDAVNDPKNRQHQRDIEAMLRYMRFAPTDGGERWSHWRFMGRS